MFRSFGAGVRVGLLGAVLAAMCPAQVDRSSLTGTVLDPSGKAIPNALVVATQSETGVERSTRSNGRGLYEVSDMPVGAWTAVFSAPGFLSSRYEAIEQGVGQTRTLDPVLRIASSGGDQVTVNEALPQVNQSSVSLGQSIQERAIEDLPLNGRNWASLTALSPAPSIRGAAHSARCGLRAGGAMK